MMARASNNMEKKRENKSTMNGNQLLVSTCTKNPHWMENPLKLQTFRLIDNPFNVFNVFHGFNQNVIHGKSHLLCNNVFAKLIPLVFFSYSQIFVKFNWNVQTNVHSRFSCALHMHANLPTKLFLLFCQKEIFVCSWVKYTLEWHSFFHWNEIDSWNFRSTSQIMWLHEEFILYIVWEIRV